jgi:hypothetical protein
LLSYPLKTKIPLEYMIVEVMFSEIFHLPNPHCLEIAYGSILVNHFVKLRFGPKVFSQIFGFVDGLIK